MPLTGARKMHYFIRKRGTLISLCKSFTVSETLEGPKPRPRIKDRCKKCHNTLFEDK
jgi:hypothetical protein